MAKVIKFDWQGVDRQRAESTGVIEAPSLAQARASLASRGVRVTKIKRQSQGFFSGGGKKISLNDRVVCMRQLATMLGAGVPIAQSLRSIGDGHESKKMEGLLSEVARDVESGTSLSAAFAKHPKYYDQFSISMARVGEETGKLDLTLERLAHHMEKAAEIRRKVVLAMLYPVIVLIIAVGVTAGMVFFMIPVFQKIFADAGASLPALTQAIVDGSDWVRDTGWILFLGIIAGFIVLSRSYRGSDKVRLAVDRFILKLPVVGNVLRKSALARFSNSMAIIFGSGVTLVDAMETVAPVVGNRAFEISIQGARHDVSSGQSLEASLARTKLFPPMILHMIRSGEESGELELMLYKVSDFYQSEVDDTVDGMQAILQPVIITFIGVLLGFVIVGLYLPFFDLASSF